MCSRKYSNKNFSFSLFRSLPHSVQFCQGLSKERLHCSCMLIFSHWKGRICLASPSSRSQVIDYRQVTNLCKYKSQPFILDWRMRERLQRSLSFPHCYQTLWSATDKRLKVPALEIFPEKFRARSTFQRFGAHFHVEKIQRPPSELSSKLDSWRVTFAAQTRTDTWRENDCPAWQPGANGCARHVMDLAQDLWPQRSGQICRKNLRRFASPGDNDDAIQLWSFSRQEAMARHVWYVNIHVNSQSRCRKRAIHVGRQTIIYIYSQRTLHYTNYNELLKKYFCFVIYENTFHTMCTP